MINTEGLVTTIKCGKNGSATISVGGRANEIECKLILQQLIGPANIGEEVDVNNVQPLPSVVIEFFEVGSIDSCIRALEALKERMQRRMKFYMAC